MFLILHQEQKKEALWAEEKEYDMFLKAAMFREQFYNGTNTSDSDAKLSDKKDDVSDVSQGKKGFTRQMVLKKKKPMAAPPPKASTLVEVFKEEGLELRKVIQESMAVMVAACQEMAVEQWAMNDKMVGMFKVMMKGQETLHRGLKQCRQVSTSSEEY